MKIQHYWTSNYKLRNFGYGEWVEEPDYVEWEDKGIIYYLERIHLNIIKHGSIINEKERLLEIEFTINYKDGFNLKKLMMELGCVETII